MPKTFLGSEAPTGDQLVTPEAAVVEVYVAGVGSRACAALIDATIQALLMTITIVSSIAISNSLVKDTGSPWIAYVILGFAIFVASVGYAPIFETIWHGKTPGKAIMGLRVTTIDGAPIRFRHAFIRGAVAIVEIWMLYAAIALIVMIFNSRSQRIGDIIAGTVVMRERQARKKPTPVRFTIPAGTEDFVATLDTALLSDADYINLRTFLTRAPRLIQRSRDEIAAQLTAVLGAKLFVVKPENYSNELFLNCIAAAYQERFRKVAETRGLVLQPTAS